MAQNTTKHRAELLNRGVGRETTPNPTEELNILEQIKQWSQLEYKSPSYYHYIQITHIHADEIIREITFPNAFIKHFTTQIDPHTAQGTYTITLVG